MQAAETTFPLIRVLMALELSEGTVTNWSRSSSSYGLEITPSGRGRGRSRQMTLRVVTKLSFMKALVDAGLAVSKAAQLAETCLSTMESRTVQVMTVYTWPGKAMEIRYNGEPPELPSPPALPPSTAFTLNAAEVIKLTLQALKWQYPPGFDQAAYEAEWQPEPNPQKPQRSRKATTPKP